MFESEKSLLKRLCQKTNCERQSALETMIRKYEDLEVFNPDLEFSNGFKYHGEGLLKILRIAAVQS